MAVKIVDNYIKANNLEGAGTKVDFSKSGVTTYDLTDTSNDNWISLPQRKSWFYVKVVALGKPEAGPIILKSFNIPSVGVEFNSDSQNLWFPVPSIKMEYLSLEGYMLRSEKTNLTTLYKTQFSNGLLDLQCVGDRPKFIIYKCVFDDRTDIKVNNFSGATTALKAIVSTATSGISGLLGSASDASDIVSDVKLKTETAALAIKDFDAKVLAEFSGCYLSSPVIETSQESNDFATIKVDVSFTDFIRY